MDEKQLAEIEERANAAEPDWKFYLDDGCEGGGEPMVFAGPTWGAGDLIEHSRPDAASDEDWALIVADALFAAHARQDVPALIAEVRHKREGIESAKREIDKAKAGLQNAMESNSIMGIIEVISCLNYAKAFLDRPASDDIE